MKKKAKLVAALLSKVVPPDTMVCIKHSDMQLASGRKCSQNWLDKVAPHLQQTNLNLHLQDLEGGKYVMIYPENREVGYEHIRPLIEFMESPKDKPGFSVEALPEELGGSIAVSYKF